MVPEIEWKLVGEKNWARTGGSAGGLCIKFVIEAEETLFLEGTGPGENVDLLPSKFKACGGVTLEELIGE